mgnify:CR=1 FL=1
MCSACSHGRTAPEGSVSCSACPAGTATVVQTPRAEYECHTCKSVLFSFLFAQSPSLFNLVSLTISRFPLLNSVFLSGPPLLTYHFYSIRHSWKSCTGRRLNVPAVRRWFLSKRIWSFIMQSLRSGQMEQRNGIFQQSCLHFLPKRNVFFRVGTI